MSRKQALEAIVRGILADVADYRELKALLGEQFEAAVHHQTERIAQVGVRIVGLAERMEERRLERVRLAGRLGAGSAMAAVFALMPGPVRELAETSWSALETMVRECKALNSRNCQLLMDQHEIMQRVLDSEANVYAPT